MAVKPITNERVRWSELSRLSKFNTMVTKTVASPMKAKPVLSFMINDVLMAC